MKKSILQSFCFCFIASTFIIATASCGNSKGGETNEDSINQAHIDSINQEKKILLIKQKPILSARTLFVATV